MPNALYSKFESRLHRYVITLNKLLNSLGKSPMKAKTKDQYQDLQPGLESVNVLLLSLDV